MNEIIIDLSIVHYAVAVYLYLITIAFGMLIF